jgi:hypothetical protein
MRCIDIAYDVAADPDVVFAFLTDFSRLREWRSLESMRTEPDGPLCIGSRLWSTVRGPGRPMAFTNEVTDLDPARRFYRDRFLDGTFPIQSSWRVEAADGGARIHWHTEYAGRGFLRPLAPFLGRAIRQGQMQDLAKLGQLLAVR